MTSPWARTQSRLLLALLSCESGFRGGREMEAIYPCVAGLDVHKQTVVACVRRLDSRGRVSKQVKTFGTMTRDLLELGDWLHRQGVTHVAMESTGVYWKPVFHLLEGRFTEILLVNAQHIKTVPGRKTDVKDCEWIAQLLQCGLLVAVLCRLWRFASCGI